MTNVFTYFLQVQWLLRKLIKPFLLSFQKVLLAGKMIGLFDYILIQKATLIKHIPYTKAHIGKGGENNDLVDKP